MDIDSCFQAGYVIKRHGLKGEVKVHLDIPFPPSLESIFVKIDNRLVPFFIQTVSVLGNNTIVKLEELNTPEEANQMARAAVYLPNALKPKTTPNDFGRILVGYTVICGKENLGIVENVSNHALNPLLIIKNNGKELLIPATEYFIKKVNHQAKEISVDLPEGLLDI